MNDGLSFEAQWNKLNTLLEFQNAHDNTLVFMALGDCLKMYRDFGGNPRSPLIYILRHCCKTVCLCTLNATGSNTETIALCFTHSMIT